eukprot:4686794-Pyramimonas_sp.AAC.1
MAVTEDTVDTCAKCFEDTSGACKLHRLTHANCAVRCAKDGDGDVTLDPGEYIKQLRPIQQHELTGADAEAKASNMVTGMTVNLRGALAYALITEAWLM